MRQESGSGRNHIWIMHDPQGIRHRAACHHLFRYGIINKGEKSMRTQKEGIRESLLESIADCGLDAKQSELAEAYLDGETDVCELQIEAVQDITDNGRKDIYEKVKKCYERLARHKEEELIRRYFEVTFQIFGTSLHGLFLWNHYVKNFIPSAKRVAIYVADASRHSNYHQRMYESILYITKDREKLKEALSYVDQKYRNEKLNIWAAMFYKDADEGEEDKNAAHGSGNNQNKVGNVFNRLSAFLSRENKSETIAFETNKFVRTYPEEFEQYTRTISFAIPSVFHTSFTEEQKKLLHDYICDQAVKSPVPKEIVSMIEKVPMNTKAAELFVSNAVLNYRLSPLLYGFLKVCLAVQTEETLNIMRRTECRKDMNREIIRWHKDFALEDVFLLKWLAGVNWSGSGFYAPKKDVYPALAILAKENPQAYITAMRSAGAEAYEVLAGALREGVDKAFYQKNFASVLDDAKSELQQNVVQKLTTDLDVAVRADVSGFLTGGTPIDKLYPQEKLLGFDNYYGTTSQPVLSYREVYGEDDFYDRCAAFLGLCGGVYTVTACCRTKNHNFSTPLAEKFLESMKRGGLDIAHRLKTACAVYDNLWSEKETCHYMLEKVFTRELGEKKQETIQAFSNAPVSGRILGLVIFDKQAEQYKEELFAYFGETSKQVKEELVNLFADHEEWGADVLSVLKTSKKAGERELAAAVIGKYKHTENYQEDLQEAYEKEKSKKVADVIKEVLKAGGAAACDESDGQEMGTQTAVTAQSYVKECHKGGKKRSLAWLYAEPMPQVHFLAESDSTTLDGTDGALQTADEEYMQAVLLSYAGMPVPGVNSEVHVLTDPLNRQELAGFMDILFDRWMSAGAEAKKKWVLYAAAIHGGTKIVPRLQHQINEWAAASRGAIAAEAVKALSLNDSPTALLIVDGIARKYKFKQVKKAAQDALQFAAAQLNLTVEELADRIVPDLGFDERMERHFDYGNRQFTVRISPSLEIEVTNDAGKKLKTLPAVGKQDDETKATAALTEFKELKKQMKTTVKNQTLRMELALSIDRRWSVENWQKLFVKNPIMHQFAISLIWGYYEDNTLKQTFRYMEDGTFNTVDEEEYKLTGNGTVGLLHPIEMEKEEIEAWKEQLSDYEITQSVMQLDRPVYAVEEKERGQKHLERFGGKILNGLSLAGKLTGFGWSKGIPQDGGVYAEFYRKDVEADYGVELRFSGSYIGDENEEVTVYDASFYHLADLDGRGWKYNLKEDAKALKLEEVSPRYFSEVINQLTKATASSKEVDEGWKEEV